MKKQLFTLLMLLSATFAMAQYRISTDNGTFSIQDLGNANDYGTPYPKEKIFGHQISATRVLVKIEGVTYNPKVLVKNQGIEYTEFRDGNNSDATFASAAAVDAWFKENTGFKTASGGSEATTDASDLTSGTLADARVAETNVTQYESSLNLSSNQVIKDNLNAPTYTLSVGTTYAPSSPNDDVLENHLLDSGEEIAYVQGGYFVDNEYVGIIQRQVVSTTRLTAGNVSTTEQGGIWVASFKVSGRFAFRVDFDDASLDLFKAEIDGQYLSFDNTTGVSAGRRWLTIDAGEGVHNVRIIGFKGVRWSGILTEKNAIVEKWMPSVSNIFYGDSFTDFTGTTDPYNSYLFQNGLLNANVISTAIGGSGYVATNSQYALPDRIVTDYNKIVEDQGVPDKVIIAMGVNDEGLTGVEDAANLTYDRLRTVYQGDVYVVGPWDRYAPNSAPVNYVNVKTSIKNAIEGRSKFYFIDMEGVEYTKDDTVHPDDEGHKKLGEYINTYFTDRFTKNVNQISNNNEVILNSLVFKKYIPDGYISPRSYGAVLDGVTDDRTAFLNTLSAAGKLNKKIWIDSDMFLDVEETGTKSIFLEDNIWIEGENDANIIVNNILSPAFYLALVNNITIKNINFLYDQTYIADYGEDYSGYSDDFIANLQQIRNYLRDNKGITFDGLFPVDRGFVSYYPLFAIHGSEDVYFENVSFKSKGNTADTFMPWIVKMQEQYSPNQTVSAITAPKSVTKNINFKDIVVDGVIMGVQGLVDGIHIDNMKSYRYSDFQDINGDYLGGFDGTDYDFPPPHLIYLTKDVSNDFNTKDVYINNVIDYGEYVGTSNVRGLTGVNIGFANSLKLVEAPSNVYINNYKSFRRDGLGSLDGIQGGIIKNLYSEGTIDIFDPTSKVSALRLLLNNVFDDVRFEDITIIDKSTSGIEIFPMSYFYGNNVVMENVNLYMNELSVNPPQGAFGIGGNNNKIKGSIHIENHTATDERRPVIFKIDSNRNNDANNSYEIDVFGWRNIDSAPVLLSPRMLFSSPINDNNNYAFIRDVDNNMEIEQKNSIITHTWVKDELITLGSGTSQALTMNLPRYYALKNVMTNTTTATVSGTINLGTTVSGSDLLTGVSNSTGIILNRINEVNPNNAANRSIYINSDTNFSSTGVVKVTLELERIASENGHFGTDFISSN